MGFVFQGAALFDSLSVYESLAYPLAEHTSLGEAEIRERLVRTLSLVGLGSEVLGLLPAELSGGMKKRVGIARALSVEPEVLLFDEPTGGLDPTNAKLVGELIRELRAGVCDTAIVVTHDLGVAKADPERVAGLIAGRFATPGSVAQRRARRSGAPACRSAAWGACTCRASPAARCGSTSTSPGATPTASARTRSRASRRRGCSATRWSRSRWERPRPRPSSLARSSPRATRATSPVC